LKKPIYLISDEPYVEIVYDGIQVPSLLKAYDNTIIVSSYSKTLSVPGERIGYIAVHPKIYEVNDVINALVFCTRTLGFVNAPALMQRIMARLQDAAVDVTIYQNKRDLLCAGLKKAGYHFAKPQGTFYLFVRSPIPDDVQFVKILLQKTFWLYPAAVSEGPVISVFPIASTMLQSLIQ